MRAILRDQDIDVNLEDTRRRGSTYVSIVDQRPAALSNLE